MTAFSALFLSSLGLSGAWAQADLELVRVNGTPIRRSEIVERLWQRHGPQTMQQMIDELLLRQAALAKKIKAGPAEVKLRRRRLEDEVGGAQALEARLRQAGSTLERLDEELAEAIAREKLVAKERRLAVKDEELQLAFAARREELGHPVKVRLRHIQVQTEEEALKAEARLRAGEPFEKVARDLSAAPSGETGGEFGWVTKGSLPPDWDLVVFELAVGERRVLQTPAGRQLIEVAERREAVPADFGEAKARLRELLLQEKVLAALPLYLRELRARADIRTPGP